MGTRADFYIEKENELEWLGSIAWDGYDIGGKIPKAKTDDEYRKLVEEFLVKRKDATFPKEGWPWPWSTSKLTDETYLFKNNKFYRMFGFYSDTNNATTPVKFALYEDFWDKSKSMDDGQYIEEPENFIEMCVPNMENVKNVKMSGVGSGLLVVEFNPEINQMDIK